jgi:3-oxoacid CoA-transferase subunit A
MLNGILIIIGIILNVLCIVSIKTLLKDKNDITWKSFPQHTLEGKKYIVVRGASSVDKMRGLKEGDSFRYDEIPDDAVKKTVERHLHRKSNQIYDMMTHTCPIDYLPTEMFMSTRQNTTLKKWSRKAKSKKLFKPDINRSTEIWLGDLEKKIDYQIWFCGHYHIDKQIHKIQLLCHDIRPLHMQVFGDASCLF